MRHLTVDYARPATNARRHVPWWVSVPLILAMVAMVLYRGGTFDRGQRSRQALVAAAKSDVANLATALDAFAQDVGRYPSTAEGFGALVAPPQGLAGWHGPYIKRLTADPWGRPYTYTPLPVGYDVESAGPDGKFLTADDIAARCRTAPPGGTEKGNE